MTKVLCSLQNGMEGNGCKCIDTVVTGEWRPLIAVSKENDCARVNFFSIFWNEFRLLNITIIVLKKIQLYSIIFEIVFNLIIIIILDLRFSLVQIASLHRLWF
jgi:hypothetical protein